MSGPEVSVVIPTRDRAATLGRAVRSVLDQAGVTLEVVIVDDGSTDATPEVVAGLADDRVRYVHQAPAGANRARNRGLAEARAPRIAFQDSDDEWCPGKLARQVAALDALGRPGLCYTALERVGPDGSATRIPRAGTRLPGPDDHLAALVVDNFVSTQTVLADRSVLDEAGGFDADLPRLQDWELWLRLARTVPFVGLDDVLVRATVSPDSITRDAAAMRTALERILARHADLFAGAPEAAARRHRELQRLAFAAGDRLDGLRHLAIAARLAPATAARTALRRVRRVVP